MDFVLEVVVCCGPCKDLDAITRRLFVFEAAQDLCAQVPALLFRCIKVPEQHLCLSTWVAFLFEQGLALVMPHNSIHPLNPFKRRGLDLICSLIKCVTGVVDDCITEDLCHLRLHFINEFLR